MIMCCHLRAFPLTCVLENLGDHCYWGCLAPPKTEVFGTDPPRSPLLHVELLLDSSETAVINGAYCHFVLNLPLVSTHFEAFHGPGVHLCDCC